MGGTHGGDLHICSGQAGNQRLAIRGRHRHAVHGQVLGRGLHCGTQLDRSQCRVPGLARRVAHRIAVGLQQAVVLEQQATELGYAEQQQEQQWQGDGELHHGHSALGTRPFACKMFHDISYESLLGVWLLSI
ncbi:hypothetical protein FQZ97_717210 [compost metagenome]